MDDLEAARWVTIRDTLAEHNKSLSLLHDTLSKMNADLNHQRTRLADMEAKLAYYVEGRENRIIQ